MIEEERWSGVERRGWAKRRGGVYVQHHYDRSYRYH